jgi:hypothetical protein
MKQMTKQSDTSKLKQRILREITQEQIIDFDEHSRDLKTLKQQVKEKEGIVGALEQVFDKMLTQGYSQEDGTLKLALRVSTRRTVAWKEKFAAVCGPNAVDDALKDAPESETRHVVVVESANPVGKA